MIIAIALTTLIIVLLFAENWALKQSVSKIQLRILVNGTRGKSTVVKYVSSVLRANNIKTLSKITGAIPTLYLHDNDGEVIKRRGGARVTEQFKIIRRAAHEKVNALVLECMSISPELQKIESRVLKPHYYVITNIREDHLEEFGKSKDDWVKVICEAIPKNTFVVTADKDNYNTILSHAKAKNSKVYLTEWEKSETKNVFSENLSIAKTIARLEELNSVPETGHLNSLHTDFVKYEKFGGKNKINFINCFSANDVQSTENEFMSNRNENFKDFAFLNTRADRPLRTISFVKWLVNQNFEKYFIAGSNAGLASRLLVRQGINKSNVTSLSSNHVDDFLNHLDNSISCNANLLLCGNIKGSGMRLLNLLKGEQ